MQKNWELELEGKGRRNAKQQGPQRNKSEKATSFLAHDKCHAHMLACMQASIQSSVRSFLFHSDTQFEELQFRPSTDHPLHIIKFCQSLPTEDTLLQRPRIQGLLRAWEHAKFVAELIMTVIDASYHKFFQLLERRHSLVQKLGIDFFVASGRCQTSNRTSLGHLLRKATLESEDFSSPDPS